jgi:hypothetical protein
MEVEMGHAIYPKVKILPPSPKRIKSVLLISVCYLYKWHLGARNLSDLEGVKYLFPSLKCKSIYNIFDMHFVITVSHCSKKPTIKIIDW